MSENFESKNKQKSQNMGTNETKEVTWAEIVKGKRCKKGNDET